MVQIIEFDKLMPLDQIKGEINLQLFNSKEFTTDDMVFTNQLIEQLRKTKLYFN